jgi:hypothetical protein
VDEQDVESLLGIGNVLPVLCWSFGLDALQVCFKDLVDGTGRVRNVRSVTGSYNVLVYPVDLRKTLSSAIRVKTYDTWPRLAQGFVTEQC